jgi:hypothetical protein
MRAPISQGLLHGTGELFSGLEWRRHSRSGPTRQILGMVVTGLSNQEISSRRFLAESTVKSHLSSAYSKLGVRSRGEVVALILDRDGSLGRGTVAAPNAELRAV